MSYLPNQYEDDPKISFEFGFSAIRMYEDRLKKIRELFLRYETSPSFADQQLAYQEMRKIIMERDTWLMG